MPGHLDLDAIFLGREDEDIPLYVSSEIVRGLMIAAIEVIDRFDQKLVREHDRLDGGS